MSAQIQSSGEMSARTALLNWITPELAVNDQKTNHKHKKLSFAQFKMFFSLSILVKVDLSRKKKKMTKLTHNSLDQYGVCLHIIGTSLDRSDCGLVCWVWSGID